MNICHVASTFLPVIGGAELAVHYIAKYQAADENVVVIAPHDKSKSVFQTNYGLIRYPFPNKPEILEIVFSRFIYKYLLTFKADVIHAHMAYPAGYLSVYAKNKLKIPTVVTPQGADVQVNPEIKYGMRLNKKLAKRIEFALNSADAIGSVSKSIRNILANIGVDEKKLYEIPNGVDLEAFKKEFSDSELREVIDEYGLSRFDKVLIVVGRNHPKKGFDVLIDAIALTVRDGFNIGCLIVGKETESLYPQIKNLGLNDRVILTGQIPKVKEKHFSFGNIPDPKLLKLYKVSDIFILPSLVESFGIVTAEAMASGLSIIVTDVEGSCDVVKDGITGLLAKPGDPVDLAEKIKIFLKNRNLSEKFKLNIGSELEKFDWKNISKKYLYLYQKLIDERKAGRIVVRK